MLRICPLLRLPIRGVRSRIVATNRPPYPFYFKSKGWQECGPYYKEIWEWPEKSSGWSVIPSWFPGKPEPTFNNDEKSQKTGYPDPQTDKFIPVEDATPELVVPDLEGFELKPYVSFRTPETEADAPPLTSKDLFDIFYADRVTKYYSEGKYADGTDSVIDTEIGDKVTRKKVLIEKGLPVLDDGWNSDSVR